MNYRKPDFYSSNGCRVLYGKKAVKIDKDEKASVTSDFLQLYGL